MEDILHRLEGLGYRLTPQRMMVVAAVERADGHISAEEIYSQIRARHPRVNISTVYRTLDLLKAEGLVAEIDLGEGRVRYHPVDKGHHHHLICRRCGAIIDMDEATLIPLKGVLREKYGFESDLRHLAVFGHCLNCAKLNDADVSFD
ncbi:MAG: Fur family transcriptional regulator [Chloroflexota bacterium]|nr:Fur family transcriptional regulator [Chloroflexota bacterium]